MLGLIIMFSGDTFCRDLLKTSICRFNLESSLRKNDQILTSMVIICDFFFAVYFTTISVFLEMFLIVTVYMYAVLLKIPC